MANYQDTINYFSLGKKLISFNETWVEVVQFVGKEGKKRNTIQA